MGPTSQRPLPALLESATDLFGRTFNAAPTVCGWAPGRVNLIGEHVDYCGGFVMPIAIERQTVVVARRTERGTLSMRSTADPSEQVTVGIGLAGAAPPARNRPVSWRDYVLGVVCGLREIDDRVASGLELIVAGNVPLGAGLSSSASLEVAVAMAVQRLFDLTLDPLQTARLCQHAEHVYAGVPCGIMDQYTACLAEQNAAVLIDCESEKHKAIPLSEQVRIVIADSGVKHALAGGEYADRRRACERALATIVATVGPRANLRRCSPTDLAAARSRLDPTDFRRARHVIGECERTLAAADAMTRSDWPTLGRLMAASHASLRDDFEVSCREVDELVDRAASLPGVYGVRMTGGGFGGCIVAVAAAEAAETVVAALSDGGRLCFATGAMAGAHGVRF